MLCILVILSYLVSTQGNIKPTDKLQHLHILFRHGDRTPIGDIINGASVWPLGLGQLTDTGILQEFELGQWIRREYSSFIPKSYSASQFHMRSTDIDRTLQSAQAVSAGIYQNTSSPLANYSIDWRPIPVHTVPQTEDILLTSTHCPCLRALRDMQYQTDRAVEFEHKHSKLFRTLSDHLNRTISPKNVSWVGDILICMRAHNKLWPSWVTSELFEEIIEVSTFYWKVEYIDDHEILRLEIGVFLNTVLEHISAVVNVQPHKEMSVQHTMVYSAHDTDVSYILGALGTFSELIEYSGVVVLELWGPHPSGKNFTDYRLRLRYKRGYLHPGIYVPIHPCDQDSGEIGCPLAKVFGYLKTFRLTENEFNEACAVQPRIFGSTEGTPQCSIRPRGLPTDAVIGIVMVAIATVVVLIFFTCRRASRVPYARLDAEV